MNGTNGRKRKWTRKQKPRLRKFRKRRRKRKFLQAVEAVHNGNIIEDIYYAPIRTVK